MYRVQNFKSGGNPTRGAPGYPIPYDLPQSGVDEIPLA
jgi:hypothetical protein